MRAVPERIRSKAPTVPARMRMRERRRGRKTPTTMTAKVGVTLLIVVTELDLASKIVDSAGLGPSDIIAAKMNLDAAFQAIQIRDKDVFHSVITSLTKLGLQLNQIAKVAVTWVKEHPCLTAAIVISCIVFACTPVIIGAAGFGADGIVAGTCAC
jgi:hypothetical protein